MEHNYKYDYEEDKKYIDNMVAKIMKVMTKLDSNHFKINKYKKQVKEILDIAFRTIDDDFSKVYERYHKKKNLLSKLISGGQKNCPKEYFDTLEEAKNNLGKVSPKKYFLVSDNNKSDRNKTELNDKLKKSPFIFKDYGCI